MWSEEEHIAPGGGDIHLHDIMQMDIKNALSTMGIFKHPYVLWDCRENHCPIVHVSSQLCKDSEYSKQEIMGNNLGIFSGDSAQLSDIGAITEAVRSGSSLTTHFTLLSKSGISQPHLVSICPVYLEFRHMDPVLVCYVAAHNAQPLASGSSCSKGETSVKCAAIEIAAAATGLLLGSLHLLSAARSHGRLTSSPVATNDPAVHASSATLSTSKLSPFMPLPPRTPSSGRGWIETSPRGEKQRKQRLTKGMGFKLAGPSLGDHEEEKHGNDKETEREQEKERRGSSVVLTVVPGEVEVSSFACPRGQNSRSRRLPSVTNVIPNFITTPRGSFSGVQRDGQPAQGSPTTTATATPSSPSSRRQSLRRRNSLLRISTQRLAQEHRLRSDSQQLLEQHIGCAPSSRAGSVSAPSTPGSSRRASTNSQSQFDISTHRLPLTPQPLSSGSFRQALDAAAPAGRHLPTRPPDEMAESADAVAEAGSQAVPPDAAAARRRRSVTWDNYEDEEERGGGADGGGVEGGEIAIDLEAGGGVPLLTERQSRGPLLLSSSSFDVASPSRPSPRTSLSVLVPAVLAAASSAAAVVSSAAATARQGSLRRASSFRGNGRPTSRAYQAYSKVGVGEEGGGVVGEGDEEGGGAEDGACEEDEGAVCVVDATAGNGATGECYICLSSGRPRNDDDDEDEEDEDESNSNEPLDESVRPHACPCVCASLYVHSVCLRVWRQQTKYTDCSVCHTPWTDKDVFEKEMEEVKDVPTAAELQARQAFEDEQQRAAEAAQLGGVEEDVPLPTVKELITGLCKRVFVGMSVFGLAMLLLYIQDQTKGTDGGGGEEDDDGGGDPNDPLRGLVI